MKDRHSDSTVRRRRIRTPVVCAIGLMLVAAIAAFVAGDLSPGTDRRLVRADQSATTNGRTLAADKSAGTPRQNVNLPYQAQRSNPVRHRVDFSVVVTPPYRCEVLKVWLPLPQSDFAQQITESRLSTFPHKADPQIVSEPVHGNKFAYFEFHEPRGAQIIRHRFTAKIWELRWGLDPEMVKAVDSWPEAFNPYRQPPRLAGQKQFRQLLGEIVPRSRGPADDLFKVMRWIDANLTYDHSAGSLQADAEHAFTRRRGHCSDYHSLCATMGRALGYPARVTYGLALYPKNSPSHCKMEAWLPPYGWVSFDLSETQKLVKRIAADEKLSDSAKRRLAAAARRRLFKGFRENSWLLVTRGTDYELAPRASRAVSVVRTIYAEADGEPLPEPDPANPDKREFAWMTVHNYESDRPFKLPFQDLSTLGDFEK